MAPPRWAARKIRKFVARLLQIGAAALTAWLIVASAGRPIQTPGEAITPPGQQKAENAVLTTWRKPGWTLSGQPVGKPLFFAGGTRIAVTVSRPNGEPEMLLLTTTGRILGRWPGWTSLSAEQGELLGLSEDGGSFLLVDAQGTVKGKGHAPGGGPILGGWPATRGPILLTGKGLVLLGPGHPDWLSRGENVAVQRMAGGRVLLAAGGGIRLLGETGRTVAAWPVGIPAGQWRGEVLPAGGLAVLDPEEHLLLCYSRQGALLWARRTLGTDLGLDGRGDVFTWNHRVLDVWGPGGERLGRAEGPEITPGSAAGRTLVLVNEASLPNRVPFLAVEDTTGHLLWRRRVSEQITAAWPAPGLRYLLLAGAGGLEEVPVGPLRESISTDRWRLWYSEDLEGWKVLQAAAAGSRVLLEGSDGRRAILLGRRNKPLESWEGGPVAYAAGGGVGAVVTASPPGIRIFDTFGRLLAAESFPGYRVRSVAAGGSVVAALLRLPKGGSYRLVLWRRGVRLWERSLVGQESPVLAGVESGGRVLLRYGAELFLVSRSGIRGLGQGREWAVGGDAAAFLDRRDQLFVYAGSRLAWRRAIGSEVAALGFSPAGRELLLVVRSVLPDLGSGRTVLDRAELFNVDSGRLLWRKPLPLAVGALSVGTGGLGALALLPDIRLDAYASGLLPDRILLVDSRGRIIRRFRDPVGVTGFSLGDGGHLLYLGDALGRLQVLTTGR